MDIKQARAQRKAENPEEGFREQQSAHSQKAWLIACGESQELDELQELLKTAGAEGLGQSYQWAENPNPNTYMGRGKLDEVMKKAARAEAEIIVADDELTARQQRNLESILGLPVIDRTALILDIFARHAQSAEGKLQVELAQLEYNMARMRGLWPHLERLGGGIGTRGPGETQIETDQRIARKRISILKKKLNKVKQQRAVMRSERQRSELPSIALIGYTNSGKSSLLNRLTGSEVSVEDRLFETLDPTTRALVIERKTYLLSDTVGFIRKLPHQLVNAFAATLTETLEADLLLHIVDASENDREIQARIEAVNLVLKEMGGQKKAQILVANKRDLLKSGRLAPTLQAAICTSAQNGEGLEDLEEGIAQHFERNLTYTELLLPYSEGDILSVIYRQAGRLEREDREDGVLIKAKLPAWLVKKTERYQVGIWPN